MRINCDLYYSKQDIKDTIDRLVKLFEELDESGFKGNMDVIQEAIDGLYEIVEDAE
jgi:hypothetical protein